LENTEAAKPRDPRIDGISKNEEAIMKGHIRRRGKQSWAIAIYLGRDERGKRKYKWHTVKGGRRQAENECARLLNQLSGGEYVEPTRATVDEYLERWLEDYARSNVAGKTFERYAEIIRTHLVPAFGGCRLNKLHPLQIQAYYSLALQSGRKDGKGGLSAQTVLHHHRVLKDALTQAVRWRLLARNPADAVEPPRPAGREMQVLDEAQTAQLLKHAEGKELYLPILLGVTTGLRRGEILAARWSDVDFEAGTLAVCQSLEHTKAGGLVFKQPKTRRSRRVVALPTLAIEALRKHRAAQARHRLQAGTAYADHDLICARFDGQPRNPGAVTRSFRKLIEALDLPRIRFHDLRHSHATQLLRQDIHPKVVSERLGHSTIGITLDTYSHVLPGMQEQAAKRIDSVLRAALKRRKPR
jgi:integrase